MSYNDFEKQFTKYLLITLEAEREIEVQRQLLGRILIFEPYAAFKRINRQNSKKLDLQDITTFLKDNDIKFSEKFIRELIAQYDKDHDAAWNFEE